MIPEHFMNLGVDQSRPAAIAITFVGQPDIASVATWSGSWDSALSVLLAATAFGLAMNSRLQELESRAI
jgi:hypothetical protein